MKDEFESAFTLRNLYKALLKCCQGTMWKDGTALYRWDGLENSVKLRKSLMDGSYTMQHYMRFRVARPKPRDITATRVRDRHGQRSACDNVLYLLITRSFIRNNGACQRGRGVDDTIERAKEGLRNGFVFLKWHFHLTPTGKVIMRAAQGVAKEEKRRLRRMAQKVREGKATAQSVRTHYAGWRAHIARGNTRALLKSMDAYLDNLLHDLEKEEPKNEH